MSVAEQGRELAVGIADDSRIIDDDHRIGSGVECAACQLGSQGKHGRGAEYKLLQYPGSCGAPGGVAKLDLSISEGAQTGKPMAGQCALARQPHANTGCADFGRRMRVQSRVPETTYAAAGDTASWQGGNRAPYSPSVFQRS